MPQCCFIIGQHLEGHDLQCPHPAIAQCADLNCGDDICSNHGERCEGCGESYCMPHAMSHKCGIKPQSVPVRQKRKGAA